MHRAAFFIGGKKQELPDIYRVPASTALPVKGLQSLHEKIMNPKIKDIFLSTL